MRWRRSALISLAIVTAAVLIWKYAPLQVIRWSGGRELVVNIESAQPIRKVRLVSIGRREAAESLLADAKLTHRVLDEGRPVTFDPYDGKPVQILILTGGKANQSGRDYSYSWFQSLIVAGEYADGQTFEKLVDVPDPRITREITVVLP